MKRLMGLDVGDRTIGVAVSDPLMITAQGVKTIRRKNYNKDLEEIKSIINLYEVSKIIVGLPKRLDGTIGIQSEKVMKFADRLKLDLDLPIEYQDERFTTSLSEKILINADVKRKKRKMVIDKLAAVQILTTYIDKNRRENG